LIFNLKKLNYYKTLSIITFFFTTGYLHFYANSIFARPIFELVQDDVKDKKKVKNITKSNNTFKTETTLLKSRSYVDVDGPKVTLNIRKAPAKEVLVYLARIGGYGYVFLNDKKENNSKIIDLDVEITLSFFEEDYGKAFNNVLRASGLKAKIEGKNIFIGKSISSREYSSQISKLFYLKQASASSAADYLASLGAAISKVSTSTVSSSSSSGPGGSPQGDELSRKQSIITNVETYGSSVGPLVGITGTTDSRLQTITLVGEPKLIAIAEKYLKQIDIRQKQVALNVKVLDVNLLDGNLYENSFAFRQQDVFIVNQAGNLVSNFGSKKVPSTPIAGSPSTFSGAKDTSPYTGYGSIDASNIENIYNSNSFYDFLSAQISSSETNVLASPTIILSENQDSTGSESNQGMGRSSSNEGLIRVGNQVVSSYKLTTDDNGNVFCEPEFSTAGISLGAKLLRIDNDEFITFVLEPSLSAAVGQQTQGGCGTINTVNERKLESGAIRVKNKHTLILTGVLSDTDIEVIKKWPILGDVPFIGNLFKSKTNSKEKRELVILVTPTIIDDNQYSNSYKPKSQKIKENINL